MSFEEAIVEHAALSWFTALGDSHIAGLPRPDISILSDQFRAEVRGLKHKNVAAELLEKLHKDELKVRPKRTLVQSQLFSEKLKKTLNRHVVRLEEPNLNRCRKTRWQLPCALDHFVAEDRGTDSGWPGVASRKPLPTLERYSDRFECAMSAETIQASVCRTECTKRVHNDAVVARSGFGAIQKPWGLTSLSVLIHSMSSWVTVCEGMLTAIPSNWTSAKTEVF